MPSIFFIEQRNRWLRILVLLSCVQVENLVGIKHLRIFGSACYVHIPSQRQRNMDKKAVKEHLIGCDGDECIRIWIKESHKAILCREENPGNCVY